jgi:hypothetical protein
MSFDRDGGAPSSTGQHTKLILLDRLVIPLPAMSALGRNPSSAVSQKPDVIEWARPADDTRP